MKTTVYEFSIVDVYSVEPQFDQQEYMKEFGSYEKINIQILGDENSSLITINSVADYFEVSGEISYEWTFTKSNFISCKTLIAIVYAVQGGEQVDSLY